MAELILGSTTAISESSGAITIPTGTLGSGITFPAGHVIGYAGQNEGDCVGSIVNTGSTGDVINSGVTKTIASGNKALILISGWMYTSISGSTSDRNIHLYKSVDGGSDTDVGIAFRTGEVMAQYERDVFSAQCFDNSTGSVVYKLKVAILGTAGTIYYYSNMFVFEIKG